MAANLNKFVYDDIQSFLIPTLQADLINRATAAKWPAHITSQLILSLDDGELFVSYPESIKIEVDNLEYGNQGELPVPVLRPFAMASASAVENSVGSSIQRALDEGYGVW